MVRRYESRAYWFGLCVLARNLLLAFAPAHVALGVAVLQASIALSLYSFATLRFWPWRGYSSNLFDAALGAGLLVFLVMGTSKEFAEGRQAEAAANLWTATLCMACGFIFLICVLVFGLLRILLVYAYGKWRGRDHRAYLSGPVQVASFLRLLERALTPSLRVCFAIDKTHMEAYDTRIDFVVRRVEKVILVATASSLREPASSVVVTAADLADVPARDSPRS